MKQTAESEDFYRAMPRYAAGSGEKIGGKYLPPLIKNFQWKGEPLTLTICPGHLVDEAGREAHYYPGEREELIEKVLRLLTVEENRNFNKNELILFFTLKQFFKAASYSLNKLVYQEDEIDFGIMLLTSVRYRLTYKKENRVFSPIGFLDKNAADDDIFYRAIFSPFFFKRDNPLEVPLTEKRDTQKT